VQPMPYLWPTSRFGATYGDLGRWRLWPPCPALQCNRMQQAARRRKERSTVESTSSRSSANQQVGGSRAIRGRTGSSVDVTES